MTECSAMIPSTFLSWVAPVRWVWSPGKPDKINMSIRMHDTVWLVWPHSNWPLTMLITDMCCHQCRCDKTDVEQVYMSPNNSSATCSHSLPHSMSYQALQSPAVLLQLPAIWGHNQHSWYQDNSLCLCISIRSHHSYWSHTVTCLSSH